MATVTPLIEGSLSNPPIERDGTSAAARLRYLVTGLATGEDATKVTGIPQPFSVVVIDGTNLKVDRPIAHPRFDGEAEVEVLCSTDGRFRFPVQTPPPGPDTKEWSITFQTETIRAPFFVKEPKEYYVAQNDGTTVPEGRLVWVNHPVDIKLDFAILTRTVYLFGLTDAQMRAYNGQALYAIGDLHTFNLSTPSGGFDYWQYLAPTIIMRQDPSSATGGTLEITYTWKSDPGNGPVGINSANQNEPGATRATPGRAAFSYYQVASLGDTQPPRVFTVSQFPPLDYDQNGNSFPNPYLAPNEWQTLPGNPLG